MTLRELRERQEWTQEEIARITGVDIRVIENIESGTPVDWATAASITAKIRNYVGGQAVEGLHIPQKRR